MASRRVTRRAPRVSGLAPIVNSIRRTQSQRGPVRYANPRPMSVPQMAYGPGPRTAIIGGYSAKVVPASGTVTVYCGPQGVGTVWYPQAAAINTTTGANDASTVAFYAQPTGTVQAPWQVGQSYAGGGDQVGLAGIKLVPGERLYAVWSGGHSGDVATMILTGKMTVLA